VVTEADLVQEEREVPRKIALYDAVREARDVNLDLAAQQRAVASGVQDVSRARSVLLPQVEVSGLGAVIDDDLAQASRGTQAERSFSGSAAVSQVIFSEKAWSNLQAQEHLQRSRESELRQVQLDVVQEAAAAYLNVLRAKTFERIQKTNLQLTRSNLELARVRESVGSTAPGEVLRWESQIATDRKSVIEANAQRNLAEMALNRVLHRPSEEPFQTVEAGLEDRRLLTAQGRLFSYISNRWIFKVFRKFMVREGTAASPELKRLDSSIAAQERLLKSARRTFWAPTVAAQGELSDAFSRAGSGSDLPPPGGDLNWSVGVKVSLPILQGGARIADARKAEEDLRRLRLQREATAERIEQRIRSALHRMGAAYAGIGLSEDAAVAAHENLNLVTDAYSRGAVSVLDLLDAQNAALVAERVAANAVFDFLVDLVEAERSVGRFAFFMSPAEVDAFYQRLEAFYVDSGASWD
jgi:outer membrane protein TolC